MYFKIHILVLKYIVYLLKYMVYFYTLCRTENVDFVLFETAFVVFQFISKIFCYIWHFLSLPHVV